MNLALYIDHTCLKPDCTETDILKLCAECIEYGFATVCVPLNFVALAHSLLQESKSEVCTVVGFPLGYSTTESKCFETEHAIQLGADEIDMVIAINQVKSKQWDKVKDDIQAVLSVCRNHSKLLKVIIETAVLSNEEKIKICNICADLDVDFVKTSTGFSKAGATIADITLMREHLPSHIRIKASGGIGSYEFATELINAGASRLGCSRSVNVINL